MIYSLQMRQPRGRDQKRVQHLGMSVLTALEGHLETVRDLLSVSQRCSQQQSRGKWPRGVYSKSSVQDRTGFDLIFPPTAYLWENHFYVFIFHVSKMKGLDQLLCQVCPFHSSIYTHFCWAIPQEKCFSSAFCYFVHWIQRLTERMKENLGEEQHM